jgi:hypothetical protein
LSFIVRRKRGVEIHVDVADESLNAIVQISAKCPEIFRMLLNITSKKIQEWRQRRIGIFVARNNALYDDAAV